MTKLEEELLNLGVLKPKPNSMITKSLNIATVHYRVITGKGTS